MAWRLGWRALSPREREVLLEVLRGQTNKEIASALGCSSRTIEFHVSNILKKTGMSTRVNLLIEYFSGDPHADARRDSPEMTCAKAGTGAAVAAVAVWTRVG